MTFTRLKTLSLLVCALLALSFPGHVSGAGNNNNKKGSQPVAPPEPEAVIEEVNAKQLEKLLADKDYVAVFWCKWEGGYASALGVVRAPLIYRQTGPYRTRNSNRSHII